MHDEYTPPPPCYDMSSPSPPPRAPCQSPLQEALARSLGHSTGSKVVFLDGKALESVRGGIGYGLYQVPGTIYRAVPGTWYDMAVC